MRVIRWKKTEFLHFQSRYKNTIDGLNIYVLPHYPVVGEPTAEVHMYFASWTVPKSWVITDSGRIQ